MNRTKKTEDYKNSDHNIVHILFRDKKFPKNLENCERNLS